MIFQRSQIMENIAIALDTNTRRDCKREESRNGSLITTFSSVHNLRLRDHHGMV